MVADSHSISNWNRNYFSQFLNLLHGVNDVLLTAKCTAEPLIFFFYSFHTAVLRPLIIY
jgi:hypothetical protein